MPSWTAGFAYKQRQRENWIAADRDSERWPAARSEAAYWESGFSRQIVAEDPYWADRPQIGWVMGGQMPPGPRLLARLLARLLSVWCSSCAFPGEFV